MLDRAILMSIGALACGAALGAAPPATPATPASAPAAAPAAPATRPAAPPAGAASKPAGAAAAPAPAAKATLEETRLTLSKWIETQQIISKERNDWQQARDVLLGRVDLVGKEVAALKERIAQSESAIAEAGAKRDELLQEKSKLIVVSDQLRTAVVAMEARLRELSKQLPEPVLTKLQPLMQRIPTDPGDTRVTVAERYQNVLGILNELNKANSEITVAYEIRTLADGVSSEVQVVYVGLAQAYFLSPRGEAGIGRPSPEGWKWEPAPAAAEAIATTLEIIQGKRTPSFVPLPVTIQ